MKKIIFAVIFYGLLAGTANAAGTMDNITQDIYLNNAEVISGGGSNGGSGSAFLGVVKFQKTPGEITIGRITNNGGIMKNITQTIRANNAKIRSDGAPIIIGEISNE